MKFRHIIYHSGKVARIVFNRPENLNAQGYLLLEEVDQAFELAVSDRDCGAIVLSGAGRAFSAGHDLGTEEHVRYCEEHGFAHPKDPDMQRKVMDMYEFYVKKTLAWRSCPKPTVAMVHGYCIYGGWMLAAAMDVVFAAEDALFLPGMVEYFSAPWDLGPRKAKEILLEHRFVTAAEALACGFVNRTFPADRLEEETLAYTDRVADNYVAAPSWTGTIKTAIRTAPIRGHDASIGLVGGRLVLRALPSFRPTAPDRKMKTAARATRRIVMLSFSPVRIMGSVTVWTASSLVCNSGLLIAVSPQKTLSILSHAA